MEDSLPNTPMHLYPETPLMDGNWAERVFNPVMLRVIPHARADSYMCTQAGPLDADMGVQNEEVSSTAASETKWSSWRCKSVSWSRPTQPISMTTFSWRRRWPREQPIHIKERLLRLCRSAPW